MTKIFFMIGWSSFCARRAPAPLIDKHYWWKVLLLSSAQ